MWASPRIVFTRAPRLNTPSGCNLARRARALASHLELVAARKSRVLWELDIVSARRCAHLARQAHSLASVLELSEKTNASSAVHLNLAAQLVVLQTEANRLAPEQPLPASAVSSTP